MIFVQCPGRANFKSIHETDLTIADILFHYVFTIEYCWNVLDSQPSPRGVMTSIIDLKGLRWSNVFSGEQGESIADERTAKYSLLNSHLNTNTQLISSNSL